MERRPQQKKQTVIVSSSSYFSDGTALKQKRIAYVKNSSGERGQAIFVNKNGSQTQARQTSNVDVVKRYLGIIPKAPVASVKKKPVKKPAKKR